MKRGMQFLVVFSFALTMAVTTAAAQSASWRQILGAPVGGTVFIGEDGLGGGQQLLQSTFITTSTLDGAASVNFRTGELKFAVRGLVFANDESNALLVFSGFGGKHITIGTTGEVTKVKGVLVCDDDGSASSGGDPLAGHSVLVETPPVLLSSTGDAVFNGNIGPLPAVCSSEPDIAFAIVASDGNDAVTGFLMAYGAILTRSPR